MLAACGGSDDLGLDTGIQTPAQLAAAADATQQADSYNFAITVDVDMAFGPMQIANEGGEFMTGRSSATGRRSRSTWGPCSATSSRSRPRAWRW